jgi:hypothetical protein
MIIMRRNIRLRHLMRVEVHTNQIRPTFPTLPTSLLPPPEPPPFHPQQAQRASRSMPPNLLRICHPMLPSRRTIPQIMHPSLERMIRMGTRLREQVTM